VTRATYSGQFIRVSAFVYARSPMRKAVGIEITGKKKAPAGAFDFYSRRA
jgi:hypothetical protein